MPIQIYASRHCQASPSKSLLIAIHLIRFIVHDKKPVFGLAAILRAKCCSCHQVGPMCTSLLLSQLLLLVSCQISQHTCIHEQSARASTDHEHFDDWQQDWPVTVIELFWWKECGPGSLPPDKNQKNKKRILELCTSFDMIKQGGQPDSYHIQAPCGVFFTEPTNRTRLAHAAWKVLDGLTRELCWRCQYNWLTYCNIFICMVCCVSIFIVQTF